MRFLSRESNNHRLNGPLPIDPESGLYTRNFFLFRLKEEHERNKRTRTPSFLLVANVDGICTALTGKASRSSGIDPAKLVKNFLRQARRIDIKGWLDERTVGILMIGTEVRGANEVKQRICHQIEEAWPVAKDMNLNRFFQIHTFSRNPSISDDNSLGGDLARRRGNAP
jgi:hypothetical protein